MLSIANKRVLATQGTTCELHANRNMEVVKVNVLIALVGIRRYTHYDVDEDNVHVNSGVGNTNFANVRVQVALEKLEVKDDFMVTDKLKARLAKATTEEQMLLANLTESVLFAAVVKFGEAARVLAFLVARRAKVDDRLTDKMAGAFCIILPGRYELRVEISLRCRRRVAVKTHIVDC